MNKQKYLKFALLGLALSLTCVACDGEGSRSAGVRSEVDLKQSALEAEQAEEEIARLRQIGDDRAPASKETAKTAKTESKGMGKKSPKAPVAASAETVYVVQVGTFKVEDNADRLEKVLKDKGLPAFKKKVEREGGVVLYAVRLEPTPTHSEAEKFVASLKDAGQPGVILKVAR